MNRHRPDRCPGVLRPWPAEDGLLVRLRVPGGRVATASLTDLIGIAEDHGDGRVRVTTRANLQIRAMPAGPDSDALPEKLLLALEATGLLPSRNHDLVRNVMASPRTGVAAGRADLRPLVTALDAELCADPELGQLPGRFLFVLDDGTGDLRSRSCDLGLVALDATRAQLRVGRGWGDVVALSEAHLHLVELARRFHAARSPGPDGEWHVDDLAICLVPDRAPHRDLPDPSPPPPYGAIHGGLHIAVPPDGLDRTAIARLSAAAPTVVVTPWRGVLVPEETL